MATPRSEDVDAVLGAVAAGGTFQLDGLCHVQGARAFDKQIISSSAGGSTKASLMEMVGEGDSPHRWLLRAQIDNALFKCMVWKTRLPSLVLNCTREVPASTAEGPASASGLAAALFGAWERPDWARQLTTICGTATASFGCRSELLGAAFGRDMSCSMRTDNCSLRARAAARPSARRCVQTQVPSRQSLVLGHK